jgi:hypothetical protein
MTSPDTDSLRKMLEFLNVDDPWAAGRIGLNWPRCLANAARVGSFRKVREVVRSQRHLAYDRVSFIHYGSGDE